MFTRGRLVTSFATLTALGVSSYALSSQREQSYVKAFSMQSTNSRTLTHRRSSVCNSPLVIATSNDCNIPACVDTQDLLAKSWQSLDLGLKKNSSSEPEGLPCPLGRAKLGESSWNLIHTMAAHYPQHPSEEDKVAMQSLISAIARFYPCPVCAQDFRESIFENPPKLASREELVLWWCERHNEVNRKLGKNEFTCSIEQLDKRWKKGGANCQRKH